MIVRGVIFAVAFAGCVQLAPVAYAERVGPPDLDKITTDCRTGVTGPDTVEGVYTIVGRALRDTSPCRVTLTDAAQSIETVALVRQLIERDLVRYGCVAGSEIGVCRALQAVDRRARQAQDDYAALEAGEDVVPVAWRYDVQGPIGGYANRDEGFSFVEAALRAGQPNLAAKIVVGDQLSHDDESGRQVYALNPSEMATQCAACAASARDMLVAVVYARALDEAYTFGMGRGAWAELASAERVRHARWRAYHFGAGVARVQLPWELAINDFIYRRELGEEEYRVAEGVRSRVPEAPESAWVVMHPSVGVTMKNREGADTTLAAVVELVGYSRWSYDEQTQARSSEWGASVIAAYQPADSAEDWGYGVLVRTPWNNVNVAWVRTARDDGDDDDSFLVSVDVSQLFAGLVRRSNNDACRGAMGDCER